MKNKILISVDELNQFRNSDNFTIIDTRSVEEYQNGHIPGAINIHLLFTYLVTESNGGMPRLAEIFIEEFSKKGISTEDIIVLYEDTLSNGYGQSCRGYFILKYLGHLNVLILHGGFSEWLIRGGEVSVNVHKKVITNYLPHVNNSIIATHKDILDAINNRDAVIIDCRDEDEWIGLSSSPYGKDFCPRKGRIPGAIWMDWHHLMDKKFNSILFKSKKEIILQCGKIGITRQTKVILYCFKGSRTSNTMVALRLAGFKNVRNYLGSWNEWSRDFSLPIENCVF